jgi:tRNA pseudouridine55 synthase
VPAEPRAARRPPRDGLVVVDKPAGWTSHDVVARLRRLAGTRRVGHAGTLDPPATGVLVVGVGAATRLLHHLVLTDKAYLATIRLGQSTVTDDATGALLGERSAQRLPEDRVVAALRTFVGRIDQVPSAVSAVKVGGKRAYHEVRAGNDVQLAPRKVTVSRFVATRFSRPTPDLLDLDVEVECSSGTYVRALARDLGALLDVGGHLTALRRTRVGPFTLAHAHTLDALAERDDPVTLPLTDALRAAFPVRVVDDQEAAELSFGRSLHPRAIAGTHAALTADGKAVALLREESDRARPVLVFRPAEQPLR